MARTLTCACTKMGWEVAPKASGTHVICYCVDCQAFDNHLKGGRLDAQGGTHLFQTYPNDVRMTFGHEHLACLRLSPRGLLRWYAGCCGSPIANTLAKPGFPFVGMILPADAKGFGKVRAQVNTVGTRATVKEFGFNAAGLGIVSRALIAKLSGRTKSPFFKADGTPVLTPDILTLEQRHAATP